jgi:hypothetical protein
VLKKEYKFEPSNAAGDEEPDADGITPSMLEFSWERDVSAQVCYIGRRIGAILTDDSGHKNKLERRLKKSDETVSTPSR